MPKIVHVRVYGYAVMRNGSDTPADDYGYGDVCLFLTGSVDREAFLGFETPQPPCRLGLILALPLVFRSPAHGQLGGL